jgi:hypothetical protein
MRRIDYQQSDLDSYLSPEQRERKGRPLRAVTDEILNQMSPRPDAIYEKGARPSIPPERLLRVRAGGDKGLGTTEFVHECRHVNVTLDVAQNTAPPGGSTIDAHSTRRAGYDVGKKREKRIEGCFGWWKIIALLGKLKHRGLFKVA